VLVEGDEVTRKIGTVTKELEHPRTSYRNKIIFRPERSKYVVWRII
jgi:hypothetical protein